MNTKNPTPPQDVRPSRRDRLHQLAFAGAFFGTALLTLAAAADPKLPPFKGE
jgi:hypothetical protein